MNSALLQSATMFAMAGAVMALSAYVTMWTGLLSFASVCFAAVGGYAFTYFTTHTHVGWELAIIIGIGLGAVAGLAVGRLFARLSSHWLALATVALMLITRVLAVNMGGVTGGSAGEPVPVTMTFMELLALLVITCGFLALLQRSKFGLAADATREDPDVAAALGVPITRVRLVAFAISGGIGAIGGAMEASQLAFINPDTFYVTLAVTIIASVVLGGAYVWLGPVVGAIVFTGLPVYISQYISQGQDIINGVLLVVIIVWLPGGLVDPTRWRRFRERRRARAVAIPPPSSMPVPELSGPEPSDERGMVAVIAPGRSPPGGPALSVDSMCKQFGGLSVLESVTFEIPSGTIFGIAGPNGAGKTTLLNLITGFGRPTSGKLRMGEVDATGFDARQMNHLGVARTFQNIRLFRGMTVREQVAAGQYGQRNASMLSSFAFLPVERADIREARRVADELLEFVGLAGGSERLAETLSYGDQRRLEIARALASGPKVLLLDEPTAGMNDADWRPIAELFGRLKDAGITVVVVEHNMRLIERYCDRVAVIAFGSVIADEVPYTCLRLPAVREAYFGK